MHLVHSRYARQTLDERLVFLCRALDGLCEGYGLARQDLMARLDADQQEAVKNAIATSAQQVRDMKNLATSQGAHRASEALARIEGRIVNARNHERRFGLAVTDLLSRFGLLDADIMDEHYKMSPRMDGRKHWSAVISRYRGRVIHNGYLDLADESEGKEVWAVINHLHDITSRIALRILEYDGGYQPTVVPYRSVPFELDWVKPDTPAGALGYVHENPPSQDG